VVQGEAHEHVPAGTYYDEYWERAREAAEESYRRLAADNDVIVAEGAGSIGEINLHDRDLANVETARFADADILLLVDIERGGAFASLYGTIELVPDALRERIVGALITKFGGDPSLLEPGIEEIESKTGVPILGVLPYDDPGLPRRRTASGSPGAKNGASSATTTVFPQSAGFGSPSPTALNLERDRSRGAGGRTRCLGSVRAGRRRYSRSTRGRRRRRGRPPGTKNTVDDLLALHDAGFADALAAFEGPIVGVCGGYQLLGERDHQRRARGDRRGRRRRGTGPVTGRDSFRGRQAPRADDGSRRRGRIAAARGSHGSRVGLRDSRRSDPRARGCDPTARGLECGQGRVGTYLHGLFDNASVRTTFLDTVAASAGIDRDAADSPGAGRNPARRPPTGRRGWFVITSS